MFGKQGGSWIQTLSTCLPSPTFFAVLAWRQAWGSFPALLFTCWLGSEWTLKLCCASNTWTLESLPVQRAVLCLSCSYGLGKWTPERWHFADTNIVWPIERFLFHRLAFVFYGLVFFLIFALEFFFPVLSESSSFLMNVVPWKILTIHKRNSRSTYVPITHLHQFSAFCQIILSVHLMPLSDLTKLRIGP